MNRMLTTRLIEIEDQPETPPKEYVGPYGDGVPFVQECPSKVYEFHVREHIKPNNVGPYGDGVPFGQ